MDINKTSEFLWEPFTERLRDGDFIRIGSSHGGSDGGYVQWVRNGILCYLRTEGWGVEFDHVVRHKLTPQTRIYREHVRSATPEEIAERLELQRLVMEKRKA